MRINYDERHVLCSLQRLHESTPGIKWDYVDITREIRQFFTPPLTPAVNVINGITGLREKGLIV
jgi:hypothetical protein